jgi:hypothetical protein
MYYYKRIKKYEPVEFNIPFLVGRVIHAGMEFVFKKDKAAIEKMTEVYRKEKAIVNEVFVLDEKQTKTLNEQEIVTQAMLKAYRRKYERMINDMTLIGTEVEGALLIEDNVTAVIKLDNLVRIRKKKVLHELKTTKSITPEYVSRIQTDKQTGWYFRFYNILFPNSPIEQVMYDVIKKPSIRNKKGESYPAFLARLEEYYDKPDDMGVFHIERFDEPAISEAAMLESVRGVAKDMLGSHHKEDYYQNFDLCMSYYGDICPYFNLCHRGGESKENLVLYSVRKSYHVNKENKELKG